MVIKMFPCDKCGVCCRKITKVIPLRHLALPNGVCRYLNQNTNLCNIYDNRPIYCNVDAYYNEYLSNQMSREEFYTLNMEHCNELKKLAQDK